MKSENEGPEGVVVQLDEMRSRLEAAKAFSPAARKKMREGLAGRKHMLMTLAQSVQREVAALQVELNDLFLFSGALQRQAAKFAAYCDFADPLENSEREIKVLELALFEADKDVVEWVVRHPVAIEAKLRFLRQYYVPHMNAVHPDVGDAINSIIVEALETLVLSDDETD